MILKISVTFIVGCIKSLVYRVKWERNINIIVFVCVCVFVCVWHKLKNFKRNVKFMSAFLQLIFSAVLW